MLKIKDHRLEKSTDNTPVQRFKISNKVAREMRELNRFDKQRTDRSTIQSRTRRDLYDPHNKELKDRLNRMRNSSKSATKKRANAATSVQAKATVAVSSQSEDAACKKTPVAENENKAVVMT